jgi:polo-like kinase 1
VGYSFEVDIWAIGIIAFTMFYGRPPFESNEVKVL